MQPDNELYRILGSIESSVKNSEKLLEVQNGRIKKLEEKVGTLEATKNYALGVIVTISVGIGIVFNVIKSGVLKFIGA